MAKTLTSENRSYCSRDGEDTAMFFLGIAEYADPDFLLLWLPTAILTGVGLGMILPSLSSSATFDLPPSRYSIGSGVNNSIRQLGSVFGIAFAVFCVGSESVHAATGFTALYSGLTTAAVITAFLGAFVRTAPAQERSPSLAVVSELG